MKLFYNMIIQNNCRKIFLIIQIYGFFLHLHLINEYIYLIQILNQILTLNTQNLWHNFLQKHLKLPNINFVSFIGLERLERIKCILQI